MPNPEGEDERTIPNAGGGSCSGESDDGRLPPLAVVVEQPGDKDGGDPDVERADVSSDVPSGDEGGIEVDSEDTGSAGGKASGKRSQITRISRQTFRAACIAGDGNRSLIARALGCTNNAVNRRILADPELNSMFGNGGDSPADPPNQFQVMDRDRDDLPESTGGSELVGQIDEEAMEKYRNALMVYGVSQKRLDKLKALDGLAKDWATHISISLRVTHQSYDGQLHNLAEMADDIKEKLADPGLSAEEYSYLSKIYVECVKEGGKGVGLMLALTEALVRMLGADKNKNGGTPKATAGWGPQKKVRVIKE